MCTVSDTMTPGTPLFTECALLSSLDGERTVVDPGRPWADQWNTAGGTLVSPRAPQESRAHSGASWSRAPEPVWGLTDAALARGKEFLALLAHDRTYVALLGAAGFLCFALVCFFATACWRYGVVVHNARAVASVQAPHE
jgi:hypothetical protein